MFNAVRLNKASQQIVSQIRALIFEGRLSPGDKLPSESALLAQFHVSKQTLKEALRALEYMGLIDMRKGVTGGAFIVEVDTAVIREVLANFLYFKNLSIRNLSEVRKIVEPYAAGMAARSISEKDLQTLGDLVKSSKRRQESRTYSTEITNVDLEFHRVIANGTNNPILVLMVDFVETVMADLKKVVKPGAAFAAEVLRAHENIYEAIAAKDEERAASEMQKHILDVEENLAKLEKKVELWKGLKE
jgi:GntR family transcriptional repressor for pyruvate dehydrogenase complex